MAKVRHLIEHTDLTYSEIAAKTGVGRASICRWARDGKWLRPPHAPLATDMVPTLRAGRRLKMRKLAGRLEALAQRYVRELEEAPRVDPDRLMQALQLVKMTRLEAMGNRRRRRALLGRRAAHRRVGIRARPAIRTALKEMQPRRRGHRPRAAGGGGHADRGQDAGGGLSGVAAEGKAVKAQPGPCVDVGEGVSGTGGGGEPDIYSTGRRR